MRVLNVTTRATIPTIDYYQRNQQHILSNITTNGHGLMRNDATIIYNSTDMNSHTIAAYAMFTGTTPDVVATDTTATDDDTTTTCNKNNQRTTTNTTTTTADTADTTDTTTT